MLNSKPFLAVDFGAANLKLAEFEINEAGGLRLRQYGLRPLGAEGMQEATREAAMEKALQAVLSEMALKTKEVNICAPGFHTFSKFVKLPPVDTSKVTQIIQYEAQQNVPFPLEEVVWDYQILGAAASGELEVLLVAVKADIVEGLFRVVESSGLRMHLVDVSPAALANAFRYNYGDIEGCTMLLDIGAKTSNLLFFEKGSVYARGINIGAQSITQDFAKESRLTFDEAERLKIEEGFVSLGGAYEEPENPNQAAISKIARQVMTRLHIQVNQTIQFYRGQQGGSPPTQLFLSGGAAIMPYTAQFFSEKLNLPVEYFNPFRNVQIDPSVNLEELAKVAHSLGEVVGLGLRNLAHCPVEMNLMPKSSLQRQQLNQKKPYFLAASFALVLLVFAYGWFYARVAGEKSKALANLTQQVNPLTLTQQRLNRELRGLTAAQQEADQYAKWLDDRTYWATFLEYLRQKLMQAEQKAKQQFNADTGIWIEDFEPQVVVGGPARAEERHDPLRSRLELPGQPGPAVTGVPAEPADTNNLTNIKVRLRGTDMSRISPDANTKLLFTVVGELKEPNSPFLVPAGTQPTGSIMVDESGLTFTFEMLLQLKRAIQP